MSLALILCLLVNSVIIMWLALSPRSTIPWHLKTCCSIASSLTSTLPRTLSAGKYEKVLKLFLATECEEIILLIQLLNINQPLIPVLPT
ncbi:hypothetical protein ZWY2020_016979, partial [Hordeum vulgare]